MPNIRRIVTCLRGRRKLKASSFVKYPYWKKTPAPRARTNSSIIHTTSPYIAGWRPQTHRRQEDESYYERVLHSLQDNEHTFIAEKKFEGDAPMVTDDHRMGVIDPNAYRIQIKAEPPRRSENRKSTNSNLMYMYAIVRRTQPQFTTSKSYYSLSPRPPFEKSTIRSLPWA